MSRDVALAGASARILSRCRQKNHTLPGSRVREVALLVVTDDPDPVEVAAAADGLASAFTSGRACDISGLGGVLDASRWMSTPPLK